MTAADVTASSCRRSCQVSSVNTQLKFLASPSAVTCRRLTTFVAAKDLKRVEAFLRRCKRCGYCSSDLPDFEELLDESDDRPNILNNTHHVLHKFLPNKTDHRYNLRSRRHSVTNCQD